LTADRFLVTDRERSFVDCLLFLDYSGGAEELDKSLAMFPSFNFDAALGYLKLLGKPWLYSRLGFLLDRHSDKMFFPGAVSWEQASGKSLGAHLEAHGAGKARALGRRSYTNMKIDPANLRVTAKATGFDVDNLEKLLRLQELIRLHPALLWKAQNVTQYLAQSKKSS
jgi:hypothetical protein